MLRYILLAFALLLAMLLPGSLAADSTTQPSREASRETARKAMQKGNYKDAYNLFAPLAVDPANPGEAAGGDMNQAVGCLHQLGRVDEIDDFREKAIAIHKEDWQFLRIAARSYQGMEHYGTIVAGKFYRGGNRGHDGRYVNSFDRDRIRSLQLMQQAMNLIQGGKEPRKDLAAAFYFEFSEMILNGYHGREAWRLGTLTDLVEMPDYEDGYRYYWGPGRGAPCNPDGSPVFHKVPKSWEAAATDGERWRWCLMQASELGLAYQARFHFASFLREQFDVQTMAHMGYRIGRAADDDKKNESGPFAVSTLGDDETIARLACGVRRFKLPDEFNFIRLLRTIADDMKDPGYNRSAFGLLAAVYTDRQQYPKAADVWRECIRAHAIGREALNQIVDSWARFEPVDTQSSDAAATLGLRFRNGKRISFEAYEILVPQLLADVKDYIREKPKTLDWQKMDISNLGLRLVTNNQDKYRGEKVAEWKLDLEPRPNHFDKRITVTTPLKKPGAYLVKAVMEGGNTSYIIMWVADTAIVRKPLKNAAWYFVADAASGQPVPGATLDCFGWRQRHIKDREYVIDIKEFQVKTDADGQRIADAKDLDREFQWLTIATTKEGRFAYYGFEGIWYADYYNPYDTAYNQEKTFCITDRPVYRPGQTVKFKFWLGHNKYDQEGPSPYANQNQTVIVSNPRGETIFSKSYTTDEFGGLDGEFPLDKNVNLGIFGISIVNHGGSSFRVEEYKKPEFEVTVDAPTEPVMLGDKITATIKAKYYFGSPVTDAKVKYKVLRSSFDANWYPWAPWDWFYEPGYWWFAYDYRWYPGWDHWGCARPHWWWWPMRQLPPEVVSEDIVPIGPDGTVKVQIDTALAKAVLSDTDHKYEISAEITDASRRTIVGSGTVSVARAPFKVYAWVNRGYFQTGDAVQTSFRAQTLDNKPVSGKGTLKLFKVEYERIRIGQPDETIRPRETLVQSWPLDTDAQGEAKLQLKAAEAGQYRLSYTVSDAKEHAIEGGYVFVVRDDKFTGREFRFNDLELITDKREYANGDKIRLMINTNRADAAVALFIRPSNGVYLAPRIIRLNGKSAVEEIAVSKKDMPNFFVEAVTLAGGRIFNETREIIVPPEDRVLNVAVTPVNPPVTEDPKAAVAYKPGEKARLRINVTEMNGEPFTGSAVVSIYDKSVEYISGGSNVPEIKSFFWKWRRSHSPQTQSSLSRFGYNLNRPNEQGMNNLGVFGEMTVDIPQTREGGQWAENLKGYDGLALAEATAMPGPAAPAGAAPGGGAMNGMRGVAKSIAFEKDDAPGDKRREQAAQSAASSGAPVEPSVRKNFADTALWVAAITTKDGVAEVELPMPENLTTWKARVWTLGNGCRVGEGSTELVTRKNLIVRLQAPRFFVQKDEVVLSANVHNYLKSSKEVTVKLELDGGCLAVLGGNVPAGFNTTEHPFPQALPVQQVIKVDPNADKRVDFRVAVLKEGTAIVRMKALTNEESDATEMTFPVYVHGMLKTDSFSGALRPEQSNASLTFNVPKERRVADSVLEVRYSPSVASAMVDALPYLCDYPYGCTEQTLNRFLPTVITQKVLLNMNLDLADIQKKRTNLNAQEIGNDADRAKQWNRYGHNPVFDKDEVQKMVRAGIDKLVAQQLSDGGWGWFSGFGEQSWPHTTAVVVHGLQIARENDVAIPPGVIERGVEWLKRYQEGQVAWINADPAHRHAGHIDAMVYMVLMDADVANPEMKNYLYRDRNLLAVYAKAMFGMALYKQKDKEKLDMILQNISQYVVQDEENQTAYLKLPEDNHWWCWYGSEYEAHAYYLKLLARTDPKGVVPSRLAKYLINNRKHATYWNSTRDTAICIEAFADFIKASKEDRPDMTVQIALDGKKLKEVKIDASNFFSYDNKLVLLGAEVPEGTHKIEFIKTGTGPLYFNAYVTNFTLEDRITRAGLEIKVNRKFYKLIPVEKTINAEGDRGQAFKQKVEKFQRQEMPDLTTVKSGDLIEVELEIDSKNDYEYILFEDMKAAGCESVELRSGYIPNDLNAYVEFRDERVCFFVRALARGKHSVSYKLRAEIPGQFSALPTKASAMYAPELRGNSDEMKFKIED